ncbi:MAG: hypothetical protein L0Y36_04060 [Planctomycetales bacterium]|nr:hypothetical protein [Planctomycetales bacterium]
MFRTIDKFQRAVNNLLGLCAEGGAKDPFESAVQNPQDRKYQPLGVMILQMQDGVLERRYMLRMEKWLLCDADAFQYYVDFQFLTALLHTHFNKGRFEKRIESLRETAAGDVALNR